MKKILTLTAGLMIVASAAMAQGLNLNVADCEQSGTINKLVTNTCTSNIGQAMNLVASVILPGDFNDFIGAATLIDLQSAAATLPDWWRADAAGCRAGAVTVVQDPTVSASCLTIWDGRADILPVFQAQPGVDGVNRVRFNAGAAITSPITLSAANGEMGVLRLQVSKAKTVGTGACTGCSTAACLVLNEINFQPMTVGVPWLRVTNPTAAGSNSVAYQSAAACDGSTPTQNHTWGSIKALYR